MEARTTASRLIGLILLGGMALITLAAGCQQREAAPGDGTVTRRPTRAPLSTVAPAADTPDLPETAATAPGDTAAATAQTVPTATIPGVTEADAAAGETADRVASPPGALIAVQMNGRVGVLLDELPADMRDRVAEELAGQTETFWQELARRQVRLTMRRLNFRNFVYEGKGQLPLPPETLWSIELDGDGPVRRTVSQGPYEHDLVLIDYAFSSTLLSDARSPGEAEPALAETGGLWHEPFVLPLDPDLLLQRTGNACLNEAGFPPNSYDSENAWLFFDYSCQADSAGALGCHRTVLPAESCLSALARAMGTWEATVSFERLAWDAELADSIRLGQVTRHDGPDLMVVGDDLEKYRVIYRYFAPGSCALVEQCVGDAGWRRLLQFNATVHNVGAEPMHVGPVVAEDPEHNLFQYNACHDHFHFSDYGDFLFADEQQSLSSKQAFCVESTSRLSNNEWSPLTHPYTCTFQGVQAGWVDEYHAGLDCQWIDITETEIPSSRTVSLGFLSNPNRFLCEGSLVLDENGQQLWEPSGLSDPDGHAIQRPLCEFVPDWDVNNEDSRQISVSAAGSFVTEPCTDGLIGPRRNCGFVEQPLDVILLSEQLPAGASPFDCQAGQTVQLSCSVPSSGAAQAGRVCQYSHELGVGVGCTYEDALANFVVTAAATAVSFTCPLARSEEEPGGRYALYAAPLFEPDGPSPITCTVAN
jgi:hypothetical protein